MISVFKTRMREGRIWQGELPRKIQARDMLKANAICDMSCRLPETILAAEIRVDTGPSHIYGLLGGHFSPDNAGQFCLAIAVEESEADVFSDSIAPRFDRVYWGLPEKYATAISKGIMRQEQPLPCGTLKITCAACSEIGSNRSIFAGLGNALILAIVRQLTAAQIADLIFQQRTADMAALLREENS